MFKLSTSGVIHFPDGSTLGPPYEPAEKYEEYASWVLAGNTPEMVSDEVQDETPAPSFP